MRVFGLIPADPTTRGTDPAGARIFRALWALKKNGRSEDKLSSRGSITDLS